MKYSDSASWKWRTANGVDRLTAHGRVFAYRHYFVFPDLQIGYSYIPKNACSTLKLSFGVAQGWLTPDSDPHTLPYRRLLTSPFYQADKLRTIVVLRDPLERIASAFLDRFLKPADRIASQALRAGLARHIMGGSLDDCTFANFVDYLVATPNEALNDHWRPQVDFLLPITYTHRLRMGDLLGGIPADLGVATINHRLHSASQGGRGVEYFGESSALSVRDLRKQRDNGDPLPSYDELLNSGDLRERLAKRYAADVLEYAALDNGN